MGFEWDSVSSQSAFSQRNMHKWGSEDQLQNLTEQHWIALYKA